MSFKLFIYYCALCGGWAAFLAWGAAAAVGLTAEGEGLGKSVAIAAMLGLCVAAAVGLMDALLNANGVQRLVRVMVCAVLGLIGGAVGGLFGGLILKVTSVNLLLFIGWVFVGALVGGSVGVFDVARALAAGENPGASLRKVINGVIGGVAGGILGGVPFALSFQFLNDRFPRAGLTVGLVLLGCSIGLMIGLAQVILKQAWLRVEEGFRAGRELMLTKEETTIGRAEGCDLGLFGDNSVEKKHARILLKNNRYLLDHVGEGGETLLNDQPVSRPTPLSAGDLIRVGRSVLRFGEKEKRRG